MDPDEASRYREVLRDNQGLLDDGARRLIKERHLLDEPVAAPPPPVTGTPVTTPLTDAARTPAGTTPFSGTGGLDALGKAMADRDTPPEVGMGPGPSTPVGGFPASFVPSGMEPGPSEPVIDQGPPMFPVIGRGPRWFPIFDPETSIFGIPCGVKTVILGGGILILAAIGGVIVFARPGTPSSPPPPAPSQSVVPASSASPPAATSPTTLPDFTLTALEIWWFHSGPGSSCVGYRLKMVPAISGSTGSSSLTGPGVVQTDARPLTFDATGTVSGSTGINQYGDYSLNLKVMAGGVTKTASAAVTVTPDQGPRPCP